MTHTHWCQDIEGQEHNPERREQQGYAVKICKRCGEQVAIESDVRWGTPKQDKKLMNWAPWRLLRKLQKRRSKTKT